MSETERDPTLLDKARMAVQAFVQDQYKKPVIITSAVVCFEAVDFSDGDKPRRTIDYISLADQQSFSADYGTVAIVQAQLVGIGVEMGEENSMADEDGEDE